MRCTASFALVISLIAGAGCASAGPAVPASSLSACATAGAPNGWRQVVTELMTFCVPPSWSSSGARGWRGSGSDIEWGRGNRPRRMYSDVVMVRGSAGQELTEAEIRAQIEAANPARSVFRETETIDGRPVTLFITEIRNRYHSGADYTDGGVYFIGEATSMAAADEQLMIYRSVRMR